MTLKCFLKKNNLLSGIVLAVISMIFCQCYIPPDFTGDYNFFVQNNSDYIVNIEAKIEMPDSYYHDQEFKYVNIFVMPKENVLIYECDADLYGYHEDIFADSLTIFKKIEIQCVKNLLTNSTGPKIEISSRDYWLYEYIKGEGIGKYTAVVDNEMLE
ncbi:MAG: hypothetical protein A2W91_17230 [Bacteroidetes bacterium GWF2_38_335]|nr:MAG: hypothetical protein A2W91_17230 [Bacteroidetes bacterium GWF2_38_335]OFY81424.1 MAG: hypothetical protein A2281_08205 [Bacteroidetes bacterium RIFOXYA12_FULL_38_20]HBS85553.1 hypothetical protein [Bacteroidales bacterium]